MVLEQISELGFKSLVSSQTCTNGASESENRMLGHQFITLSAVVSLQKMRETLDCLLDRGATMSDNLQERMMHICVGEIIDRVNITSAGGAVVLDRYDETI